MSTVKTDAITAVSTNGDLSLDGLGTGGVSIASTLKMTKGGDISSASPLVIDVDGNYFDVTGTTNFSAMTVEEGNFFMLQFDGALTITHGSGIELPGAANLTTATGDRLICYATAANTVEVMSVETEAAASAGGFTMGTPVASTSGTSITFGSIPADVTMIVISCQGVSWATQDFMEVTLGDAGGLETSGYVGEGLGVPGHVAVQAADAFRIGNDLNAAQAFNGTITLTLQNASTFYWVCTAMLADTVHSTAVIDIYGGAKALSAELTQFSIFGGNGNTFDAGAINIMYQ